MNTPSIIAIIIYVIVFSTIAVVMPIAIFFNFKVGQKYRKKLAIRLHALRISKMLGALGIDSAQFLHSEQVNEINNHLNRCVECENTNQCDEQIAAGEVEIGNISYCNNEASLQKIFKQTENAKSVEVN